jgi:5-methylcytosine-specific restriction endonuclease McrA
MTYLEQRKKFIEDGRPLKEKKKYSIPKKSEKRIAKEKQAKEALGGDDTELVKWFRERIKHSTGYCSECNRKVEKSVFQYAAMTVAHILPKRDNCCPSVKTHPLNFIILCPDCHNDFDKASWEEKELMGCWNTVRDRLVMVWPDLADGEKRHFPESVVR